MLFRTELNPLKSSFKIDYNSNPIFWGSCFSENIGQRLEKLKFNVLLNPFGTTYNASSILKHFQYIEEGRVFSEHDLQFQNGIYFHYDFHSRFSHTNATTIISNINDTIHRTKEFLKLSSVIYVTLGTSWVYLLKEKNAVVSNCHKQPQNLFYKELLTVDETIYIVREIGLCLKRINPNIQICYTLSPVRHIKDGIEQNMISKSILRLALSQLNYPYFPAYEIMMDDLRDYRFYSADLIHPNEMAIEYIWDKFTSCFMEKATVEKMYKINSIIQFLNHRPQIEDEKYLLQKEKYEKELQMIL